MRWWWLVVVAASLGACANILGIDDGIPRSLDASLDVAADAAPDAHDASADGPFSALHCGNSTCNASSGQVCCWETDGSYACAASTSSCTGVAIPCDRPEQCPQTGDAGPVECCGTYTLTDAGAITSAVGCVPQAQCTLSNSKYVLCGDDSGAECQPDATCGASTFTLPTFLICR
jgi:hypothetical protein